MGFESNLNNNAVRKKEAAQKTKRGIFSPLICGEAGGGGGRVQIFQGWSSPRRSGANFGERREKKRKESLQLRRVSGIWIAPPIEGRSRYVTLP